MLGGTIQRSLPGRAPQGDAEEGWRALLRGAARKLLRKK